MGGAGVASGALWLGLRGSSNPRAAIGVLPLAGAAGARLEASW